MLGSMVRRAAALVLLVAACDTLKIATDSETAPPSDDAGTTTEQDGATSQDAAKDDDAGAPDAGTDARPPPCAEGCPVEDVEPVGAVVFALDKDNLYFVDRAVSRGGSSGVPAPVVPASGSGSVTGFRAASRSPAATCSGPTNRTRGWSRARLEDATRLRP